ncbi:MAG TPA: PAAR domain-containing protein [Saprospiraceae bacterium]|nr:PAAR domain-containing protein [Saprospiraceae bacterium]HND89882.1 PAAR domain-containing protein [Saprospiraceae bacterium]HNG89045.1 PAAR domain-containing protein [Saprospiraceae bacterium]
MHTCPIVVPAGAHVGGPVLPPGAVTVTIEGKPAAVVGNMCTCTGPPDTIQLGSQTVLIGGKPAARVGDLTAHGGQIMMGAATVLIG